MAEESLSEEFKHGPAGFCPARLTRISPWLKRYVDEKKLPFAHVAVLRKGQLAYSNCYGHKRRRYIGSCSNVSCNLVLN